MRRVRLRLEELEAKDVPTTFFSPWAAPLGLSVGFAQDGTAIGQQTSNLYQSLNAAYGGNTDAWQMEILHAVQAWAVNANVSIGYQEDTGTAYGSPGLNMGNTAYADIRIGGYAFSNDAIAVGIPYNAAAGTWSGDIFLNTNYHFGAGGTNLYQVVAHEVGHALGIDHNTVDAKSVLNEAYAPGNGVITATDIAKLQSVYGARKEDGFDAMANNDARATASTILNAEHNLGDLTTHDDVDWYAYQASVAGNLTVSLTTHTFSLLEAKISVFDDAGDLLATQTASDPRYGDLTISFDAAANTRIFVKVESGTADNFGIGRYSLQVSNAAEPQTIAQQTVESLGKEITSSFGIRSTGLNLAAILQAGVTPAGTHFANAKPTYFNVENPYRHVESITLDQIDPKSSGNYFIVEVPSDLGDTVTMDIGTWAVSPGSGAPAITVYNANREVVPFKIVTNQSGMYVVEVEHVHAGDVYYIMTTPDYAMDGTPTGGWYLLGVDFTTVAVTVDAITSGTFTADVKSVETSYGVEQYQLQHLTLDARDTDVRLDILNTDGKIVTTILAHANDTESANVFLKPGTYTLRFTASASGSYTLSRVILSDPISPYLQDPTLTPMTASKSTTAEISTPLVAGLRVNANSPLTVTSATPGSPTLQSTLPLPTQFLPNAATTPPTLFLVTPPALPGSVDPSPTPQALPLAPPNAVGNQNPVDVADPFSWTVPAVMGTELAFAEAAPMPRELPQASDSETATESPLPLVGQVGVAVLMLGTWSRRRRNKQMQPRYAD